MGDELDINQYTLQITNGMISTSEVYIHVHVRGYIILSSLTGVLCAIVLAARARNTLMTMERVLPIPIILYTIATISSVW